MFDSMHMHTPWAVALIALVLLLVVVTGFLAIRIVGQRVFDSEAASSPIPPPDDRL